MSVKNNAIYAKLLHISAKASFGGIRIENVGLPTTPDDVATKAYVDSAIGGFCPMNLSLCDSLISSGGTYYVRSSCNIRNLKVTKMMIWTTRSTSTVRVALYEDSGSQLKLLSSGSVTSVPMLTTMTSSPSCRPKKTQQRQVQTCPTQATNQCRGYLHLPPPMTNQLSSQARALRVMPKRSDRDCRTELYRVKKQ